jgi:phage gp46-like protein
MPLQLIIDGVTKNAPEVTDDLPRAIIISLFSWRRANPDDDLPGNNKYGWWGDTYPQVFNDRIGSRLWLLWRAKITAETTAKAIEYATEALQWLLDDGIAADVKVTAERVGLGELDLWIIITRGDTSTLNIRFIHVWDYINAI